MDYFFKLTSFDNDISQKFVKFLRNNVAMVKGLKFEVLEETITKVIGFPIEGEGFPKTKDAKQPMPNLPCIMTLFLQ